MSKKYELNHRGFVSVWKSQPGGYNVTVRKVGEVHPCWRGEYLSDETTVGRFANERLSEVTEAAERAWRAKR